MDRPHHQPDGSAWNTPTPAAVEAQKRYQVLLHRMQTGVRFILDILKDDSACSPKHLRVGVNAAMCDHSALVKTLVDAGVISYEAYSLNMEALMAQEVEEYTAEIHARTGSTAIVLG